MKHTLVPASVASRPAMVAGTLFFALVLAAPDPTRRSENPTAEEVATFLLDNQQGIRLSFLLNGVAYACFLVFLAVLGAELKRGDDDGGVLSRLAMYAGCLAAGFHVLAVSVWAAPGMAASADSDPALVGAAGYVGDAARNALVEIATFWRGVLLISVAVIAIRHRVMPLWLTWTTAALGTGALVGAASFIESPLEPVLVIAGFSSYIAFHVWVLLVSVMVSIRPAVLHG